MDSEAWCTAVHGVYKELNMMNDGTELNIFKGFSKVNEEVVDVFLKFSCFFYEPTDVGNLISGSSAFSKSHLNIWNFMVHILLKLGLENFEHYFTSM